MFKKSATEEKAVIIAVAEELKKILAVELVALGTVVTVTALTSYAG